MPSYQVLAPGFHEGKMYDPAGKRRTLHVDKEFKNCPSWLKPIKAETATASRSRKKAAATNAEKVEESNKAVTDATFLEAADANTVETLG